MKKFRRGQGKVEEAKRLVAMVKPNAIYENDDDWLLAASIIAEKERQSMRELYLEKSGWDTFGEVRGER